MERNLTADLAYDGEYKAYVFPLVIALPFAVAYWTSSIFSFIVFRYHRNGINPPLAPFRVPILGHGLWFFWDTGFVGEVQK